jgi:hypothetical protein
MLYWNEKTTGSVVFFVFDRDYLGLVGVHRQSSVAYGDRSLVIASNMLLHIRPFKGNTLANIFYRTAPIVNEFQSCHGSNLSSAAQRLPPPFVKEALARELRDT